MSTPQLALPAHDTAAGTAMAYDAKADAEKLDALEPQDYGAADPEPEPEPEPAPAAGTDPGAGADPGAPPPDPNAKAQASAREFIESYDYAQAMGFAWYSESPEAKAEKFQLEAFPKERAIHHLARGLEKMGSPELPWWLALIFVLSVPALANYFAAREFRQAEVDRRAAEAAKNRRRSDAGQPVQPDSATTRSGEHITFKPVPKAPSAKAESGSCGMCGAPTNPGRKYCSQSCSGKSRKKQ